MIVACAACGGLEPYIIAAAVAAWGWGAWTVARIVHFIRRKP